ncbi:hypothetical protein HPULCUR_004302 [Helicostylum pulchrum]|uniref:C2H2-type domain-containing protein n=1 Tax=Helicostylum pulchrum TaxID=562976 RepID=A0ABP9XWY0_9FUNG
MSPLSCDICNLTFDSVTELSNHNYDIHVDLVKVSLNETLSISRVDGRFDCPKCPSKLSTPTTFNRHLINKHNGRCSPVSNKRKRSEVDDTDNNNNSDDGGDTSVNGHGPSSLSESNGYLLTDYDRSVLMATGVMDRSKAHQKGILVMVLIMGVKPIILKTESGEKIYMLTNQKTIYKLVTDQPGRGVWLQPV